MTNIDHDKLNSSKKKSRKQRLQEYLDIAPKKRARAIERLKIRREKTNT